MDYNNKGARDILSLYWNKCGQACNPNLVETYQRGEGRDIVTKDCYGITLRAI